MVSSQKGRKGLYRRQFNTLLGLAGLGMALTFSACAPSGSGDNSTSSMDMPSEIRIGYQVVPNAELLAKTQGLIEANMPETQVNWIKYNSGGDVNKAMAAGELDIGLAGSVPVATGIATGLPYQVAFIHDIIGDNEALAVRTASGIVSLADVKGKKIAVPFGSTTHFSLLSALESNNIGADEVTLLDMSPDEAMAAWDKGAIDGSFIWHPTLGKMKDSNGIVLVSAKQLAEEGIITADLAVAHNDFVSQYPEAMAEYVAALDEAVELYRANPEAAAQAIADELGISPEESLTAMNELVWLNAEEQSRAKYLGTKAQPGALAKVLKASAEFMVSQGAIEQAPELSDYNSALYSGAVNAASQVASK